MADEPSGAELSPEEAYRSIGRYVYEFSQLLAHMRAAMTRYLDTSPQGVADIAFAQSSPEQLATAFFAMCRTVTRLEAGEEKIATRLGARVSEAIDMRAGVAQSDWWVGSSVLGAEAVQRSARDLDTRSESLAALTNLVSEYGALCLHQPPYDRGEHHVAEYIVMRAGEAVREGPKALDSPRVFYTPPPLGRTSEARLVALEAQTPATVLEPEHAATPPPPAAVREPAPQATSAEPAEPAPAPEPARPLAPRSHPRAERLRREAARAGGLLRASLRAVGERREATASQALPSSGATSWLTHQRLRRGMLVVAGATASGLALAAYAGNVFGSLEQNTINTRFAIRGEQRPPRDIVIVGIDNQTVASQTFPRWPAPRIYDASVINTIRQGGAKAIGVDIQFTNPTDPTDDNALIEAVKHAPGIVLSTTAVTSGGGTDIFDYTTQQLRSQLGAYAANTNVPAFDASLNYEESGLDSFGVVVTEQATHRPVPRAEFPHNAALVDFAGPPNSTFSTVSFADVCSGLRGCTGAVKPGFFRNKIVLIGATAPVLQDVHPTPEGGDMPGVEIWANEVWSILRGNPLRDASDALNVAMIILLSLLMPLAVMWLRPGKLMVAIAVAIGLAYLVAAQLEFNGGTVISVVYPLVGLTLGTAEATTSDLWVERRHRRHLEVYKAAYERLPSAASAAFFISYRREQSSWPARILRDELVRRFGEEQVFKDNDSIDAGQEWPDRLEAAVNNASVVLVLIGPQWADARDRDGRRRLDDADDWVRLEVEAALGQEHAAVVPVLVDGATMPAPEVLPDSLRPLTAHQAFSLSVERWNADLEALIASIHSGRIRDFLASERAADSGGAGGSGRP